MYFGREPWSTGHGNRLISWKTWVRILSTVYWLDGHFFTLICCKNCNVCLKKTKNKRYRGREWAIKISVSWPKIIFVLSYLSDDAQSEPISCYSNRAEWGNEGTATKDSIFLLKRNQNNTRVCVSVSQSAIIISRQKAINLFQTFFCS